MALLVALTAGLAGCGDDGPPKPPSGARVFHATPDGIGSDCGSLQGCLEAAADDDTVELAAGRYTTVGDTLLPETCSVDAVVTNAIARTNVVIRAAQNARVRIDGLGEPGRVGITVPEQLTRVVIENIDFERCWAGIGTAGGQVIIRNCTFSLGDHGLVGHETALDVSDCQFGDHTQESIVLRNCSGTLARLTVQGSVSGLFSTGSRALTISSSLFGPFCMSGVRLEEGGQVTLANCTIVGAGLLPADSTAVVVAGGTVATLEKCIVAQNRGHGVLCRGAGSNVVVSCSDFFANSAGPFAGCPDQIGQRGNIALDPLFCGPLQFQLRPDSPARLASCGVMGAYAAACPAP